MKIRNIFKILAGVWCIDFILTVILINFYVGMIESNPIPRFFYERGFWGFFMFFWITMILLALFSFFLKWISNRKVVKNPEMVQIVGILTFVVLESYCIINNVRLL